VGYTGGTTQDPTYGNLGDHTETIQIDYDPDQISYEKLLEVFWRSHDPTTRSWSRQYMSALFFHNDEQRRLAIKTRDFQASQRGQKIYTRILPAPAFYLAEAYHQKHALGSDRPLMEVLRPLYKTNNDFMNSTAVAKVNGYVGGYGTIASLEAELTRLALPTEVIREVLDILQGYGRKPL